MLEHMIQHGVIPHTPKEECLCLHRSECTGTCGKTHTQHCLHSSLSIEHMKGTALSGSVNLLQELNEAYGHSTIRDI
jgi:hypothetical protein